MLATLPVISDYDLAVYGNSNGPVFSYRRIELQKDSKRTYVRALSPGEESDHEIKYGVYVWREVAEKWESVIDLDDEQTAVVVANVLAGTVRHFNTVRTKLRDTDSAHYMDKDAHHRKWSSATQFGILAHGDNSVYLHSGETISLLAFEIIAFASDFLDPMRLDIEQQRWEYDQANWALKYCSMDGVPRFFGLICESEETSRALLKILRTALAAKKNITG